MLELIDFYKYLKCSSCRRIGLYCPEHREEVKKILEEEHVASPNTFWKRITQDSYD